MRKFLPLVLVFGLVGCSGGLTPSKNPDMIEVTGTVTMKGQPVTDVILNLQPTGTGTMATIPVVQGKFKASNVTPGKYTYFFTETSPKNVASLNRLPKAYHAGSMDRQIDINSATLDITIE